MGFTLQSFLQFLRSLVSFFRKRWDQSARRLWYIFAFLRFRFLPRHPKKKDDVRGHINSRPAKPSPTTVICASRLPPLSPIVGGDTPVFASPMPISIEVRQPTILSRQDTIDETHDNESTGHLGVNTYFLEETSPISRSRDSTRYHEEPGSIDAVLHSNREQFTSNSPVATSRPISRDSHHSASQYGWYHQGNRPSSQYSHYPPSIHSCRPPPSMSGAEAAARGYLHTRPPSPTLSVRAPSMAGSVASRVYRASKPTSRVRKPSPMSNAPRRGDRSPAAVSARHSMHEAPPNVPVPETSRPGSRTTESLGYDSNSVVVGPGPSIPLLPESRLRPMIGIDRYEQHKKVVVADEVYEHVCPALTTQFLRESPPENWTPLMHPEGALYWVHKDAPIYTDTNMCDPDLRKRIEDALEEINRVLPLPVDEWELALELGVDDETGEPICSYYFVCHATRCLFWLQEFNPESALESLRGVTEMPHIHLALQACYWNHWEMYPHDRDVPESLFQELLGILVHAGVDCMTSPNSTAAYSEGELNKLLGYVKHIKSIGGNCGFSACIIGRLMYFFSYSRFLNFYGQRGARLTNDQTIYGAEPTRTYLIKTLSIFFFYAPELHLRGLESVYTDFVLCQHRWALFITRLQDDWKEFILYGTVLLNANVAFLAVPSVDPGNRNRTPAQLASYLSIITSVGSVVIGLLLLRQCRTKPQDSSEEVDNYLRSRRHNALGFETLAILYSLPYSLLLWSMMAFTAAFCLETIVFSHQSWAKVCVGALLGVVILLIAWCISTTIEAGNDFSVLNSVHRLKDRLADWTRPLRRKTRGPQPDGGEGENGQGESGRFNRSRTLKEAFSRFRRGRGISVSSTLVGANPIVGKGRPRPSDCTGVEMGNVRGEGLDCKV